MRLSELAGIRYDPDEPQRSDLDVRDREIVVHGEGRRTRTVKISHDAARTLDRYIRVRARHAQAHRPQLLLGTGNRGPMTANGIYQVIARRGRECGIEVFPHRFRHHFSHTCLDRGGTEGDLMELNGWTSPQMLRRYGASARSARARRNRRDQLRPRFASTAPGNACRFRRPSHRVPGIPRRQARQTRDRFRQRACQISGPGRPRQEGYGLGSPAQRSM
jgi:integrase